MKLLPAGTTSRAHKLCECTPAHSQVQLCCLLWSGRRTSPTCSAPVALQPIALMGVRQPSCQQRKTVVAEAFTLIELIVVLALLATVLAVAAPALSRFFRSRTLDSEGRRFIALTRYAQSRAVSEGVPMVLWIDAERGVYGLMAETTYVEHDNKALEFVLDDTLQIEVERSARTATRTVQPTGISRKTAQLPVIRFSPDGFVDNTGLERILIKQGDDAALWIGLSRSKLNYEIQTENQFAPQR